MKYMTKKINPSILEENRIQEWLDSFEEALATGNQQALEQLWLDDCHWRDVLGLHWDIDTISGRVNVCHALLARSQKARPRNWSLSKGVLEELAVIDSEDGSLVCLIEFETIFGPAEGVLRLVRDPDHSDALKAWVLMTALVEIKGHEEKYKKFLENRIQFGRSFLGPNWLEKRAREAEYDGEDPTVLIVGGGQAGLTIAARLKQLGINALLIDQHERIGDNWRERYKALVLHNQTFANHLPYMPFPDTWPIFVPKDMLAGWLEYYATAMELNVWCDAKLVDARYDKSSKQWVANVERGGKRVTLKPRHVVMTTGVSALPDRSPIDGLEKFSGSVMHTADYENATQWIGKNVIVLGTGTSAHDVAQDLCEHGAHVTMVQRGATMVQNVVPTAQKPYAIYEKGYPLHYCDLLAVGTPFPLLKIANRRANDEAREIDKDLHTGLEKAGFRLNKGEDGIGWQMMYLTRGGGYYFNVGCSELISQGKIKIIQLQNLDHFESTGLRMKDGSLVPADLIVVAKGYLGQSAIAEKLLGKDVSAQLGPIWGMNPDTQELNNMWKPTPVQGLWFHAGSLAQCRIYSKYLALQIQARELGLIAEERS